MTTLTTKPYSWIKRVPPALLQRDSKPLIGYPPEFPWEKFSKEIGKVFGVQEISITPAQICEWREPGTLFSGIGDRHHTLKLSIAPLSGNAYWVIAEDDIALLMSMMIAQQDTPIESLDQDYKHGFYQFLALEALNTFSVIGMDKSLTPHLENSTDLPNETCLCLDVNVAIKQRTLLGRLILSPDLLQSWKERYSQRTINSSIAQDVTTTVCLEAGRISLKSSEWTKVALGDFITLDSCTLKATGEGRIMLTVQGFPCFRAKIKEGNIKILEHPLYHEGDIPMDNNFPDDEMEVDHDHDFSFLETEEEIESDDEIDEKLAEETMQEETEQTDLDTSSPLEEQVPAPLVEEEKKPFTIEDIPLSIVVEVGRLQMSVGKLMELQPGNLLDLNIHPENGVDLVVNGNRIAKGELLLIGECLGVRILDING